MYDNKILLGQTIFMVFNATINNISVIYSGGLIGGGNLSTLRKPLTCRKSIMGFELTNLVVIGTDCTDSYKSNYHTITTTVASLGEHGWS